MARRASRHHQLIHCFSICSGKSLASVRERVERQRSVASSVNISSESNSLEGLNLERGESSQKGRCVAQLDNQVISLHQDVAALSIEVSGFTLDRIIFSVVDFVDAMKCLFN